VLCMRVEELTGVFPAVASGKSALCEALQREGHTVVLCDRVWHLL
jgi:dephospho-CoA kinase